MNTSNSIIRKGMGPVLAVLMLGALTSAWGQIRSDLASPLQRPKIGSRLQVVLNGKTPGESIDVWLFFTDKGVFDDGAYRRAIEYQRKELNPHARFRRLKVRDRENLVDLADLPLHRPYIQEVLDTGVTLRAQSRWLNAISVRARGDQISRLRQFPFISSLRLVAGGRRRELVFQEVGPVGPSISRRLVLDYGPSYAQLYQIAVPQFHQWLEENDLGSPGEDVRICLLDTGFDLAHETLQHVNIIAERDFINDDDVVVDETGDPPGQDSHGTVVLSLIGGYCPGQLIGPAFGASFLLGKTEDISSEQPIEEDYWVEGIEWAEGLGADVVSSSLGYMDWYEYEDMDGSTAVTTVAADLAASRGVVVVTAAGNEGNSYWRYIIAPADGEQVIAVGAVDTTGTRADFSSLGPTYDGRIKPDVMACGQNTYVANPDDPHGYYRSVGTSLSTPLTAGVAALLLQADSTMTPNQVADALRNTAYRALDPNNSSGWGVIDAQVARQANYSIFGQVVDAVSGRSLAGASVGSVKTSASGRFAIHDLSPGHHDFQVTASGYLAREISDIQIPSWQNSLTIELQPIPLVGLYNFPNPFSESTTIVFNAPGLVKVSIFTLAGERVWERELFWELGGRCEIEWHGDNESGEEVADGIYIYQVVTDADIMRGKLVRLRTK